MMPAVSPSIPRRRRLRPAALLLLALGSFVACASLREAARLGDTQEAFSAGARLENQQAAQGLRESFRPGAEAADTIRAATALIGQDPRPHYAQALSILEGMDAEAESQLRRDGLWGAKLTLEALAHWRLGHHPQARSVAGIARTEELGDRDRVLMTALPGLLILDEMGRKLDGGLEEQPADPQAELETILQALIGEHSETSAWALLEAAHGIAPAHPVQVVLIQYELALWQRVIVARHRYGAVFSPETGQGYLRHGERTLIEGILGRLPSLMDPQAAAPMILTWKLLLGLS